jgi:hypothetical protein
MPFLNGQSLLSPTPTRRYNTASTVGGTDKAPLGADQAMNLLDGRFLLTSAILALSLLIGAIVIAFARRWLEMSRRGAAPANDQLAHFRALYEKGELSREDFQKIRDVLTQQIRHEAGLVKPNSPEPPLEEK